MTGTFMSAFIKPALGEKLGFATTYPALNTVQTGPNEMSIYVTKITRNPPPITPLSCD